MYCRNLKAADTVDNSNGKNIHMLKLTPVQNQDGGKYGLRSYSGCGLLV